MHGPRHNLLAGATFPQQQNRRFAFTHIRNLPDHLPEHRTIANQMIERITPFKLGPQAFIVARHIAQAQGPGNGGLNVLNVEGLGNIIKGAVLDQINSITH